MTFILSLNNSFSVTFYILLIMFNSLASVYSKCWLNKLHYGTPLYNKLPSWYFFELIIIFSLIGHTGDFSPFIYFFRAINVDGQEKWKRKRKSTCIARLPGIQYLHILVFIRQEKEVFIYNLCYIICMLYNIYTIFSMHNLFAKMLVYEFLYYIF